MIGTSAFVAAAVVIGCAAWYWLHRYHTSNCKPPFCSRYGGAHACSEIRKYSIVADTTLFPHGTNTYDDNRAELRAQSMTSMAWNSILDRQFTDITDILQAIEEWDGPPYHKRLVISRIAAHAMSPMGAHALMPLLEMNDRIDGRGLGPLVAPLLWDAVDGSSWQASPLLYACVFSCHVVDTGAAAYSLIFRAEHFDVPQFYGCQCGNITTMTVGDLLSDVFSRSISIPGYCDISPFSRSRVDKYTDWLSAMPTRAPVTAVLVHDYIAHYNRRPGVSPTSKPLLTTTSTDLNIVFSDRIIRMMYDGTMDWYPEGVDNVVRFVRALETTGRVSGGAIAELMLNHPLVLLVMRNRDRLIEGLNVSKPGPVGVITRLRRWGPDVHPYTCGQKRDAVRRVMAMKGIPDHMFSAIPTEVWFEIFAQM